MPEFIGLFVVVIAILLVLFVVAQVILPALNGEPLFPSFRKSAVRQEISKATKTLEEVAEVSHLKKVVSEVQRRTAEMEKKE